MKKLMKTKLVFVVLAVAMLLSACGLGKKQFTEEDAKKYVEAFFDANLKGDFEEYCKLTGESKEELEKQYEESLDAVKDELNGIGITGADLGTDFGDDYLTLIKKIYASAQYDVGEVKKDEDGNFHVEVNVYPSDVFNVFFDKIMQEAVNAASLDDLNGMMLKTLESAVDEQSFGDAVSYQISVKKNSDGDYVINDKEAQKAALGTIGELNGVLQASGKVYDNPYLNWTDKEWKNGSEEEQYQCCIAMLQYILGYTDEQMSIVDPNDENLKASLKQMKDGIDLTYTSGAKCSIGDYAELMMKFGIMG